MSRRIHSPWLVQRPGTHRWAEVLVPLIFGTLFAVGCNKSADPAAEETATATSPEPLPPAPAVEAPKPPAVDLSSIPTEQDFEEQVNQNITSKNLEAELDRLEKELAD